MLYSSRNIKMTDCNIRKIKYIKNNNKKIKWIIKRIIKRIRNQFYAFHYSSSSSTQKSNPFLPSQTFETHTSHPVLLCLQFSKKNATLRIFFIWFRSNNVLNHLISRLVFPRNVVLRLIFESDELKPIRYNLLDSFFFFLNTELQHSFYLFSKFEPQ